LAGRGVVGDPVAFADVPLSVRVCQAPVELGVAAEHSRPFGAQGVLSGSKDAHRCIGYLTNYVAWRVMRRGAAGRGVGAGRRR
jgi:hypothetical protein